MADRPSTTRKGTAQPTAPEAKVKPVKITAAQAQKVLGFMIGKGGHALLGSAAGTGFSGMVYSFVVTALESVAAKESPLVALRPSFNAWREDMDAKLGKKGNYGAAFIKAVDKAGFADRGADFIAALHKKAKGEVSTTRGRLNNICLVERNSAGSVLAWIRSQIAQEKTPTWAGLYKHCQAIVKTGPSALCVMGKGRYSIGDSEESHDLSRAREAATTLAAAQAVFDKVGEAEQPHIDAAWKRYSSDPINNIVKDRRGEVEAQKAEAAARKDRIESADPATQEKVREMQAEHQRKVDALLK